MAITTLRGDAMIIQVHFLVLSQETIWLELAVSTSHHQGPHRSWY